MSDPGSEIDLKKQLRLFVADNFMPGQSNGFADADSFMDTGVLDSTGVLELVAHLQEKYGIQVEDEELLPDNLDSIDAVATFVERKRGGGSRDR